MSKWTFIGTNALEKYDLKEEALKRKRKAFALGIKTNKMKTEKPKKIFKREEEQE